MSKCQHEQRLDTLLPEGARAAVCQGEATTMKAPALTAIRLTGVLGAELSGLDLSQPQGQDDCAASGSRMASFFCATSTSTNEHFLVCAKAVSTRRNTRS